MDINTRAINLLSDKRCATCNHYCVYGGGYEKRVCNHPISPTELGIPLWEDEDYCCEFYERYSIKTEKQKVSERLINKWAQIE